jgi:hypothetical protein
MDGADNDENGLVGQGEGLLLKEEWEEAVRVFEMVFEASGRSSGDVGRFHFWTPVDGFHLCCYRSTSGYRKLRGC